MGAALSISYTAQTFIGGGERCMRKIFVLCMGITFAVLTAAAGLGKEVKQDGRGYIFDRQMEWTIERGLEWDPHQITIPRMMTWAEYDEKCPEKTEESQGVCEMPRNFCAVIVLLCKSCCYDGQGNLEKETSQPCGICSQVYIGFPW